jgi:hypothetical protein
VGGERATGRLAGGAGQHPQDRNAEEVSAERALRLGAAGLEGSDAHPISGSATTVKAIGPAQPWPDLRSLGKTQIRVGGFAIRRASANPAMLIVTGTDETR